VAEDWFREAIQHQRKAAEVESDVRREFVTPLGDRPIADIEMVRFLPPVHLIATGPAGQIAPWVGIGTVASYRRSRVLISRS
jgi:hypothetical protein